MDGIGGTSTVKRDTGPCTNNLRQGSSESEERSLQVFQRNGESARGTEIR